MSGIIGGVGSKSGVIGEIESFQDANAWNRTLTGSATYSTAVIDFQNAVHMGTNITESGGVITIGTAGWYLVTLTLGNKDGSTTVCFAWLETEPAAGGGFTQIGHRLYWNVVDSTGVEYTGKTLTNFFEFAENDKIRVYASTGQVYGSSATHTMCSFSGFRLGA